MGGCGDQEEEGHTLFFRTEVPTAVAPFAVTLTYPSKVSVYHGSL